jgi:hypothetical protein
VGVRRRRWQVRGGQGLRVAGGRRQVATAGHAYLLGFARVWPFA